MRPRRIVARLATLFVGAASVLLPVLAQQQRSVDGSLPLVSYVTTDTVAQLAAFAARDRVCLMKAARSYDTNDDYKSCVDRLHGTTYCDAEAADIADLQALFDSDPRLSALVGSVEAVSDYVGAHCEKPWPVPSRELLAASSRALLGECHTVMPLLIAHAITLTRSDSESSERYGLCRWSLGKFFIGHNCEDLVRYRLRPGPARRPAPHEFGVESYLCPGDFERLLSL